MTLEFLSVIDALEQQLWVMSVVVDTNMNQKIGAIKPF